MTDKVYNVLFLCTGNSARSIMAEAIMNHLGKNRFHAFSAGSFPKGEVNSFALKQLAHADLPTEGYRSKSWEEFAKPDAPQMDFVFTVCDDAAGEVCPIWPGHPMTAHLGVADPAKAEGSDDDKQKIFSTAYEQLNNRIRLFLSLPLDKIDRMVLKKQLDDIGKS
jgi:arsenate reductase (thioredoxin)